MNKPLINSEQDKKARLTRGLCIISWNWMQNSDYLWIFGRELVTIPMFLRELRIFLSLQKLGTIQGRKRPPFFFVWNCKPKCYSPKHYLLLFRNLWKCVEYWWISCIHPAVTRCRRGVSFLSGLGAPQRQGPLQVLDPLALSLWQILDPWNFWIQWNCSDETAHVLGLGCLL